jgi:hypothetical protein
LPDYGHRLFQKQRYKVDCHAFQLKPTVSYAVMRAKPTFPACKAQASWLWRIADTTC